VDLTDLTRDLEATRDDALARIASAQEVPTLEAIELDVLGRKGRLTTVLRGIGGLPAEDRPRIGAVANVVRGAVEKAIAERGLSLRGSALESRLAAETVDVTTPGRPIRRGTYHPIPATIERIAAIFGQFGFFERTGGVGFFDFCARFCVLLGVVLRLVLAVEDGEGAGADGRSPEAMREKLSFVAALKIAPGQCRRHSLWVAHSLPACVRASRV